MGVAEDFDFLPVAPAVGGDFDLGDAGGVADGVASDDESVAGNFREVVGLSMTPCVLRSPVLDQP